MCLTTPTWQPLSCANSNSTGRTEKKGSQKPVRWTIADVEAFVKLKHALTEKLELFQLEPDQPFVMRTDASDNALGAVMEKEREEKRVPVAFFRRKLAGSQLN